MSREPVPALRRTLISLSVLASAAIGVLAGANLIPSGWLTWVIAAAAFLPVGVLLAVLTDGEAPGFGVAAAAGVVCAAALLLTPPMLLDVYGEPIHATVLERRGASAERSTGSTTHWNYVLAGPDGERIPGTLLWHDRYLDVGAPIDVFADPGGWAGPSLKPYDGWSPWSAGVIVLLTAGLFYGAHWSARGAYRRDNAVRPPRSA